MRKMSNGGKSLGMTGEEECNTRVVGYPILETSISILYGSEATQVLYKMLFF